MSQTESVKIVISAEDNASVVLAQTEKKLKDQERAVKGVGKSFQDSGDSVDKFARMLGGGWLSDAGHQMKEMAEAGIKAREVLNSGGGAALAMKAGLIGLTAVVAFKFGEALGNAIFKTERWSDVLKQAREEAKRLDDQIANGARQRNQDTDKEISETADPVERARARADAIHQIEQDQINRQAQIHAKRAALEKAAEERAANKSDAAKGDKIAAANAAVAWWQGDGAIKEQAETLKALESAERDAVTRRNDLIRQQADDEKNIAKEAAKQQAEDGKKFQEAVLKDLEEKRKAASAQEEERVKAVSKREEERFKQRMRETDQLSEARATYAERTAQDLTRNLAEAQSNGKVDVSRTSLQATESRFLSRSTSAQDYQKQSIDQAKKSAEIQKASKAVLDNMAGNIKTLADRLGISQIVEF